MSEAYLRSQRDSSWRLFRVLGIFLGAAFLLFPSDVFAQAPDMILDLLVTAEISENGETHITETILYDFGPKKLHGIFRNIPLQAQEGNTIRKFGIGGISVTDRDGIPVPFETSDGRTHLRLKIGEEDKLVTGVVEYRISYTAGTLMRGFPTFDEWVWDATSSNWPVTIRRARVDIRFPTDIPIKDIVRSCATFPPGDPNTEETCQVGFMEDTASGTSRSIQIMDLGLIQKEGMLVGIGFPKGIFKDIPQARSTAPFKSPHLIEIFSGALMLILVGAVGKEFLQRYRPELVKE